MYNHALYIQNIQNILGSFLDLSQEYKNNIIRIYTSIFNLVLEKASKFTEIIKFLSNKTGKSYDDVVNFFLLFKKYDPIGIASIDEGSYIIVPRQYQYIDFFDKFDEEFFFGNYFKRDDFDPTYTDRNDSIKRNQDMRGYIIAIIRTITTPFYYKSNGLMQPNQSMDDYIQSSIKNISEQIDGLYSLIPKKEDIKFAGRKV